MLLIVLFLIIFTSHLQDPRIMQTVAVLLGIDADGPDTEGKCHYT